MILLYIDFKFVVVYLFLPLFFFKDYFNLTLIYLCLFIHVYKFHLPLSTLFASAVCCTVQKIHYPPTILSTSTQVLFAGHNHLLTTSVGDLSDTLIITRASARVIMKVKGHWHWWLTGGYLVNTCFFA